jgi:hypothetical protein
MAGTKVAQTVVWLALLEMDIETEEKQPPASTRKTPPPVAIFCDIQRSIQRMENPEFHILTRSSMFATAYLFALAFNGMLTFTRKKLYIHIVTYLGEVLDKFARLLRQ